jgi:hypothetical protein
VGEEKGVSPLRNKLLHTLFSAFTSHQVFAEGRESPISLHDLLALTKKTRIPLDKEKFFEQVVPPAVRYLVAHFSPIQEYLEEKEEPFIRYVTDTMPSDLQVFVEDDLPVNAETVAKFPALNGIPLSVLQEDAFFLKSLDQMFKGKSPQAEDAANLIAQAKIFLADILPETLLKQPLRDFGPKRPDREDEGEIARYEGARNPLKTKIGYHWEAAAFYYQWICAYVPTKKHFQKVVEKLRADAKNITETKGIPLHKSDI